MDESGRLVVRRHQAVVAVANDPGTFSSGVSRFLQIPNGLDGESHADARSLLDPFLAADQIDPLEPVFAGIARRLIAEVAADGRTFDGVHELGARYAVRAQSAWLGWGPEREDVLLEWVDQNRAAARSGDSSRMRDVAEAFGAIIRSLLAERRAPERAPSAHRDVTAQLMAVRKKNGESLSEAELVSILRNWTGGDLASLALCAGVVVHWLATHPRRAALLTSAPDRELDAAIDEILRADDPFIANRRVVVRDAVVDGHPVSAGDVIVLDWRAANRDPDVFAAPDRFAPGPHAAANLVYGAGPHACPGRGLATLELRVLTRELLRAGAPELDTHRAAVREDPPAGGFRSVPVRIGPAR